MPMHKNQKGFGHVGIMVIIIVLGLVGLSGWFVWDNGKNKDDSSKDISKSQNESDNTKSEQESESTEKPKLKTYAGPNITFAYPDTWTIETRENSPEWVYFKSADYVEPLEDSPVIRAGYWLELRVAPARSDQSYAKDLEAAPTGQEMHGGTYETIKIDGSDAVLSNTKSHGAFWYATAYHNDNAYYFRLNAVDEDKPEVKELFKSVLATVELK